MLIFKRKEKDIDPLQLDRRIKENLVEIINEKINKNIENGVSLKNAGEAAITKAKLVGDNITIVRGEDDNKYAEEVGMKTDFIHDTANNDESAAELIKDRSGRHILAFNKIAIEDLTTQEQFSSSGDDIKEAINEAMHEFLWAKTKAEKSLKQEVIGDDHQSE